MISSVTEIKRMAWNAILQSRGYNSNIRIRCFLSTKDSYVKNYKKDENVSCKKIPLDKNVSHHKRRVTNAVYASLL